MINNRFIFELKVSNMVVSKLVMSSSLNYNLIILYLGGLVVMDDQESSKDQNKREKWEIL